MIARRFVDSAVHAVDRRMRSPRAGGSSRVAPFARLPLVGELFTGTVVGILVKAGSGAEGIHLDARGEV